MFCVGLNADFLCPKVCHVLKMLLGEFRKIQIFEIFSPPRPFGKTSFLASLVQLFCFGLNAYFWCPQVCRVLKKMVL